MRKGENIRDGKLHDPADVVNGKVKLDDIITHRLPLSSVSHADDILKNKGWVCEGCIRSVELTGSYN